MNAPSVFVLGVQKCGTTTIADLLAEQAEIFVPTIKETYFFCDESLFIRGQNWYLSEFYSSHAARKAKLSCDATPFYLASSEALSRIASFVGDNARFIVCLRNPVDRAYSAYWHQRRLGNEALTFEAALAIEDERIAEARASGDRWWRHAYVEVGRYAAQLERAFDLLGKDRFLILIESDLNDLRVVQDRLRSLLSLPSCPTMPKVSRSNSASMPRFSFLQNIVIRDNMIKKLATAAIPRELRTLLGRRLLAINEKPFKYPPMNPKTRGHLQECFVEEFAKLMIMGIDIPPNWRR